MIFYNEIFNLIICTLLFKNPGENPPHTDRKYNDSNPPPTFVWVNELVVALLIPEISKY